MSFMEAKKKYEEEILRRVQDMPEEQLAKVISLMDKVQEESESKKQDYQKAIAELRGKYKHSMSSTEEFTKRKEEEKRLDL